MSTMLRSRLPALRLVPVVALLVALAGASPAAGQQGASVTRPQDDSVAGVWTLERVGEEAVPITVQQPVTRTRSANVTYARGRLRLRSDGTYRHEIWIHATFENVEGEGEAAAQARRAIDKVSLVAEGSWQQFDEQIWLRPDSTRMTSESGPFAKMILRGDQRRRAILRNAHLFFVRDRGEGELLYMRYRREED